MSTALFNIFLKNKNGDILPNCWRTDLVIQRTTGTYLVDIYPEIIKQLKGRYAKPASVTDITTYPLTDQGGKTIELTIGATGMQTCTLVSPATTPEEIHSQAKSTFTGCNVILEDGHISIVTEDRGPQATITLGGTSDILWGNITLGSGYSVGSYYYQNAQRIRLIPPSGEYVKQIEVDVPPGEYIVWTRVCHGANEETSKVLVIARCGDDMCINLLLPALQTCSAQVFHPLMDYIVNDQLMADDDERLIVMRGVMKGAKLGKQDVIGQLNNRVLEAQEKGDTELEARVNNVLNLANQLPDSCY